jgi:transposase InsO family protein
VPKVDLEPTNTRLYAANGNSIPVLGRMNLRFTLNNRPMQTEVLVSNRVDELLLGYSFLSQHGCTWSFADRVLYIQGVPVKLETRDSTANVRRIYVRDSVHIPPDVIVNVPVELNFVNLRSPAGNWVTEAKEIRPGLIAARTIVSDDSDYSVVQFINISGRRHYVRRYAFLGEAAPGMVVGEQDGESHDVIACDQHAASTETSADFADDDRCGQALGRSPEERLGGQTYQQPDERAGQAVSRPITHGVDIGAEALQPDELCQTRHAADAVRNRVGGQAYGRPTACVVDSGLGPARPDELERTRYVADAVRIRETRPVDSTVTRDCDGAPNRITTAVGRSNFSSQTDNQPSAADLDFERLHTVRTCFNNCIDCRNKCVKVFSAERGYSCGVFSVYGDDVCDEFSHIQPVIDNLPDDLTKEQRAQAIELIKRNADVFSRDEFDLGLTDYVTCSIDTGDAKPFAETLRSHPRAYLDQIDNEVNKLIKAGIVEPSNGPWCSNLVLVLKKGSTPEKPNIRVTIDARRINSVTVRDHFPLPRIKDCLDAMANSAYFSTVDISSSFHQVPLATEKDRDKLSFITRKGQFRYRVMAMGACNSANIFARLASIILHGVGYETALAYIDDTVIFGATFSEALRNLDFILDRYRKANIKLKPEKAKFLAKECKFLGFTVSFNSIRVSAERIESVLQWPFPRTLTELRGFLGAVNYQRSFINRFAEIAEPLTECLRKGAKIEPNERRLQAFNALKQALVSSPVLALPIDEPDYESGWVLDCDSSLVSAAAILQQWQGGKLRVIEYASRVFNSAERRMCAFRREMAALLFGLRHFRRYLLGRRFLVRVDNSAITHFRTTPEPTAQVARNLSFLEEFDFKILHRPGAKHVNVDSLSRVRPCDLQDGEPCKQCNYRVNGQHVLAVQTRAQTRQSIESGQRATDQPAVDRQNTSSRAMPNSCDQSTGRGLENTAQSGNMSFTKPINGSVYHPNKSCKPVGLLGRVAPNAIAAGVDNWSPAVIAQHQLQDPDIAPVFRWIADCRPDWAEVKSSSPAVRALYQQFQSIIVKDGCLYRIFHNNDGSTDHLQLILPRSMKIPFLELIHASSAGHLKFEKCVYHVMRRAWWYNFKRDIKVYCACCPVCNAYHRGGPPKQAKLRPMVLGSVCERWSIDLTGPFIVSDGKTYICTCLDPFSKYSVNIAIRNKEAATVAKAIFEKVFLTWGLCEEVLTDQGLEFNAELALELYKLLGIHKIRTSAYTPKSNGACEKAHQVLNKLLAKVINESQRDWAKWLPFVTFCYNTTPNASTGFAPHFVMTGQEARWDIDFLLHIFEAKQQTLPQYTAETLDRLHKVHTLVRNNLQQAAVS